MTRVLLVSHEATRTGAPRVALQISRVLRDSDHEVVSVLRAGGPLAREFERESDRAVREPFIRLRAGLRRFRRTRPLATKLDLRIAHHVLRRERPGIAYLNTVKSACYVRPAVDLAIPVILHVHEMDPLASSTLARYGLADVFHEISLVACSGAARDNLAKITLVEPATIRVVPSTIDVDGVIEQAHAPPDDDALHPSRRPAIVGACGTADIRKGVDLWLAMSDLLRSERPDLEVSFRWVGGASQAARQPTTPRRVLASVEFCGEVENPYPLIAQMDVFTLPSRSDAFPLVVLEAMALGRAIVAFALPGVVEQLADAGVLVDPEDPAAMAQAVMELLDDPERRNELGMRAAKRVRAHFGVEAMRESIRSVVTAVVRAGERGPEVPGR